MSVSLAEALKDVELHERQVYHCLVNGQRVEVRVLGPKGVTQPARFDESDVMLDPWIEFPLPKPTSCVEGVMGKAQLPDRPQIPTDWE